MDVSKAFTLVNKKSTESSIKVYQFVIVTTQILLILYISLFLYFNSWFPLLAIAFGAIIITPICWQLAKKNNPLSGRVLWIMSCNFYVLIGSVGCNNSVGAQYFFLATSITSISLFNKSERNWSYLSLFTILMFWFLTQIEANKLLSENLISYHLPTKLFENLSFFGALVLCVSYLLTYIESVRRHYIKAQQQSESLWKEKTEALELLTKIANNVPGVVYQYRVSPSGKPSFPYASLGMQKIYRVSPEQVKTDAEIVFRTLHPDDFEKIIQSIEISAQSLEPWQCDYRVKFDDGTVEWRRGIAQPQKESDGSILWHGFITDITSEKKLEADLEQSQQAAIHSSRLASLGEMAGGIAHEINTPLMIITSKTSLISRFLDSENPQLDRAKIELEKVSQTTFRIANIVKGLLTFARGGKQVEFQNVSVDNLINDVSSLCGEKARVEGVDIQFFAENNLTIYGNSVQISQVILNLINNSIDAISRFEKRWIKVEAQTLSNSDNIRFSVTDSGMGLSDQQVERLMQPFFTTKTIGKGTGLGLSISKGLIESHGGVLTYDKSCPNTRFYFDLKSGKVAV